ncbi:MAG TPA: murein biosynthesis integral membrane protein MurJ [Phycisphaerales bacterium]|nr:murein biosynthesis integral membrane protein MurJ [Phycisphaerales bacterium]
MIKGFRQIALLTFLSRIFGLARDVCYFYYFGASGLLDAWFIAFKIPNLSRRLFGEGAASASLIPVYSQELQTDRRNAMRLASTVLSVIFSLLVGIVVTGWIVIFVYGRVSVPTSETRLVLSLTAVMLPFMIMICMEAILGGVLHVHGHFAAPAAAPIVLNIFVIVAAITGGSILHISQEKHLYMVAVFVLAAGVAQLAIMVPPLRKHGVTLRPAWAVDTPPFHKVIAMMAPMILGLTATQINTLCDDLIAWWFSASAEKGDVFTLLGRQIAYPLRRGSVSHLNGAERIYQVPLGVLGISLATAIFPVMSLDAARKDFKAFGKTLSRGIRGALFVGIPSTVGMIIVGKLLVSVAYRHGRFTAEDAEMAAMTLFFYSLGLTGYFIQQIATRAFYALHEPKVPMRSALIAVTTNVVLNLTLIWVLGTGGLACSTAICSYLQVIILVVSLRRRLGPGVLEGLPAALSKTTVATAAMAATGLAIHYFCRGMPGTFTSNAIRLALLVPACAAVFLAVSHLLGIEMLSLLTPRRRPASDKDRAARPLE